jgi:hypothetical protein
MAGGFENQAIPPAGGAVVDGTGTEGVTGGGTRGASRMKQKKPPKRIYGMWRSDTGKPEDTYFSADPNPDSMVETGQVLSVWVYELVGTAEIRNTTETTVSPTRKG